MKVKVLPPEWWMLAPDFQEDTRHYQDHQPKPVVYNRPGIYLCGDNCWFEADGGAWAYDAKQFRFTLDKLSATHLNKRQVAALKNIIEQRLATRRQVRLYQMCLYAAQSREPAIAAFKFRRNNPEIFKGN